MKYFLLISVLLSLLVPLTACEVVNAPPPDRPAPTPVLVAGAVQPEPTVAAPTLGPALTAYAQGDTTTAADQLSALINAHPTSTEATTARYYLATLYAARGRWTSAAELLRAFLDSASLDDPLRASALFWLARAHESAGAHLEAAASYQAYRALATPLAPYATLRQAAQEAAAGLPEAALESYLSAARSPIIRSERAGSFERAITLLNAAGRRDEALALYDELLMLAEQASYRARLLSEAAALEQALGRSDAAQTRLLDLIAQHPATPQAVAAVDQLLTAGVVPPAAHVARVYYQAERWADAVTWFDQAIPLAPDLEAGGELRRLRGLALRAQGNFEATLPALAEAGALSPNSEAGRQAQLDWIQTLGQNGATDRAIQAYGEYATAYPDDPRAPEAMNRMIILHERLADQDGALQTRLALGARYPTSDHGRAALHQAGLSLMAAQRFGEASQAWQTLADTNSGLFRARGRFWQGRLAQMQGQPEQAQNLFQEAVAAAPTSYEGARAATELGGTAPGTIPLSAPISPEEWAELEAWVTVWAGGPSEPPAISERAERARLLVEVGLISEANREWIEGARSPVDPWTTLALARAAHEAGMAYPALVLSTTLAGQAPADAGAQPLALQRLIFPTPYPELVAREAAVHGFDPRLFYALIRQESLFNPAATSWVGARGLGQVMPATGEGIAQNLGVADFVLDDLYRPDVSIRFGTFYLGRRLRDMEGSVQAALAAYNGGLGNAQRWAGGTRVADPDLFTEGIDFPETKGYVRSVYGFWAAYQALYAP
ncbi:MAG: transglycosylase SLT domain-containing protein [Oscillochloridaceae bacterium umkhey_bin13]